MKRKIQALLIVFIACAIASGAYATTVCGNPQTPTRGPKCSACASPSPDPSCTKDGTNNFDVYTGNVHRQITDIVGTGGVGEYPLKFERLMTSRYLGGIPTPLGTSGSWRHNYLWNITFKGLNGIGNELISIDYPNGENWWFDRKSPADHYLTAVSQTQDRVEQSATDSNQYYLIFADDGGKLSFRKTNTSPVTYQPQGLIDRYGLTYPFTLDSKGRVTRVTDPSNTRYINIMYGSIGNFPNGNITFTYYDITATSVNLAGEFNNWDMNSIAMANNNGTWTVTLPLQLAAAYQYKFIKNHSSWLPDPANWNTVPPGGPSTGNNSLVTNDDAGTTAGASMPVTFTYINTTASHVYVAGQFNNWTQAALTKNGSTWTITLSLTQGSYQYKFVVDGNWIQDPANPFTAPDGNGNYNSKLAVGPLDEGITQVQTSDGRSVTYDYAVMTSGFAIYSQLRQVNYGDHTNYGTDTHAAYTYSTPFTTGGRPIPATVDDPRYAIGQPATRMAYSYQNTGVDGFIYQEKSFLTGTAVATLNAPNEITRSVTHGNNGRTDYTFTNYQLISKATFDAIGNPITAGSTGYSDGGYGIPTSTTPTTGQTSTLDRTTDFGVVKKTTFPDLSYRSITFTDDTKPFFPATIRDENGKITTYTTRDSNNRPTRIDYPDSSYETFVYDQWGQVTSHGLRNGSTETTVYPSPGFKSSYTDASGKITNYSYDAAGRPQTITDGRGKTRTYSYNDRGQVTRITFNGDMAHPQVFTYDRYGNKESFTNEIGKMWTYGYDEYNRLTVVTDPLNRVTQYSYGIGVGGCSSCQTNAKPSLITLPSNKQTKIEYDADWRKTKEIKGYGTSDAAETDYAYDGMGNVTSMTDPRLKVWAYLYDNRNRRTRVTDPLSPANYTDSTYDPVGNKLTEKRSGDANPITYVYNDANYLTDTTDQAGHNTHMTRDGAGNMLTLRDAQLNTYTFTYDGMNRKTSLAYPSGGGAESWVYDEVGNAHTYTTRLGQIETFTYDDRNREYAATWSDSTPGTTKTYDAAGRLLTLSSSVSVLSYTYSDANELGTETQQIMSDGGPKTASYTYDADSNRSTLSYPSGSSASYTYTNRNQLASVTSSGISANYTYDLAGNRQTKSDSNNTSGGYVYDDANRLLSVDHQKNGVSFVKEDYAYNSVNDRTSRTETIGNTAKLDSYGYDPIDEVQSVRYNANGNTQDRLVGYNYDATGNRSGSNGVTDSVNGNSTYAANGLNQYITAGALTPIYDNNGNMTSQDGWSYTYDGLNRMTGANNASSGTNIVCAYDGQNRCVSRTINGTVTFFYYDKWNLLEEQSGSGALIARYVHGPKIDDLVAKVTGPGVVSYYHQDGLGSTTALTDSSGNVAERYSYDVFGAPTFRDANGGVVSNYAGGNRFLFTGREYIQQAALYDYRNRIYSPGFGRFLQTDPMRFDASDVNMYRYASNTVTHVVDPYGLLGYRATWWEVRATLNCSNLDCYIQGFGQAEYQDEAKKAAEEDLHSQPLPENCNHERGVQYDIHRFNYDMYEGLFPA
jgi:RHS repeat-associated protein